MAVFDNSDFDIQFPKQLHLFEYEVQSEYPIDITNKQTTWVTASMPASVKARFKQVCSLEGKSMNKMLNELIEKQLEQWEIKTTPSS